MRRFNSYSKLAKDTEGLLEKYQTSVIQPNGYKLQLNLKESARERVRKYPGY